MSAIQFASGQQVYGWSTGAETDIVTVSDACWEHVWLLPAVRALWRALDSCQPDILLIPGYREALAITAAVWGVFHRRTNVLMSDSTVLDLPRARWKERLKGILTRTLFRNAFVSGRRAAEYLRFIGYRPLQIEIGYDVVDNAYFYRRTAESGALRNRYNDRAPFLFVGRLHPVKNLHVLLSAFAMYRKQGGTRTLEIVGKGPLENDLKNTVHCNKLHHAVRFAGYQPYDSLPGYYARAACLVLPSVREPWGLVVNEAMASGLPVIVSDRCGCVDDLVVDGHNGFVFPADSAEALGERLRRMDALSDAEWNRMTRRSREIVDRFSPDSWSEAVLRLVNRGIECSGDA